MDSHIQNETERRQEENFRKDSIIKMQIKEQETVLADSMLRNRNCIISNMWQFDDTKRRIYQMDNDPRRRIFLDKYFAFLNSRGTPFRKLPVLARYPLDLFKLYFLVKARGGFEKCTRSRQWSYIAADLNLPTTITSAAYSLRTQYKKLLYEYEAFESSNPEESIEERSYIHSSRQEQSPVTTSRNIQVSHQDNSPQATRSERGSISQDSSEIASNDNESRSTFPETFSFKILSISENGLYIEGNIHGCQFKGYLPGIS